MAARQLVRHARRHLHSRCGWWLAALLGGAAWGLAACDDSPFLIEDRTGPSTGSTCLDIDGDGHSAIGCEIGDDCDDLKPYVNPNGIDGPWSLKTRFIPQREVVQWLSIEGDTSHWLTQSISLETGEEAEGLKYYQASGIDFGIPLMIDDSPLVGHDAKLLWDGAQTHVLHRTQDYPSELRYSSDALDWEPEIVATTVGMMRARMVMVGDELHTLFHSEEMTGAPLRYAIRRDGQWQVAALGMGRADALIQSPRGGLHIIAGDAPVCFRHGQSFNGESWSFEDYLHDAGCEVLDARMGRDDRLYVLFRSFQTVWLASYDGEQWSAQLVESTSIELGALPLPHRAFVQVDPAGVAHITYAAENNFGQTPVFYLENSRGDWTTEIVANQLSHVLAMSPEGEPIVGLSRTINNSTHPQLAIARRTGNDGIDQNCNGVDGS